MEFKFNPKNIIFLKKLKNFLKIELLKKHTHFYLYILFTLRNKIASYFFRGFKPNIQTDIIEITRKTDNRKIYD